MRLFRNHRRNNGRQQQFQEFNGTPQEFASQTESLIPAEVRMISGCHSDQTSADVSNVASCVDGKLPSPAGKSGGACTSALLGLLYDRKQTTFQQLLLDLREALARKGFDQIPQLTSSRNLEIQETPFSLVGPGNGIRRAVLVGINYRGQSGELSGCHNDVLNMKRYLIQEQGYVEHNILVMIDDGHHHYPTREKIIRALQQLVAQSNAGDSVYFHYSGHGGLLTPNWNTFKGHHKLYDETLYPLDHATAGHIRDFSLFNHFVKPMAAGVTVTCVMDCCHSGSVLDLPFTYQPTPSGTIRMHQSLESLSNLAFLHVLAGGILPHGFGHVVNYIENITGGHIDSFHGTGLNEMMLDTLASRFIPHFSEFRRHIRDHHNDDVPPDDGDDGDYYGANFGRNVFGGVEDDAGPPRPGFRPPMPPPPPGDFGPGIEGPRFRPPHGMHPPPPPPDMGPPDQYFGDPRDYVDGADFDPADYVDAAVGEDSPFRRNHGINLGRVFGEGGNGERLGRVLLGDGAERVSRVLGGGAVAAAANIGRVLHHRGGRNNGDDDGGYDYDYDDDNGGGGGRRGFSVADAAAGLEGLGANAENVDCGCIQDILETLLRQQDD